MATTYYSAKIREGRLLELPEAASELGLKPGEEIGVSIDYVSEGRIAASKTPAPTSLSNEQSLYSQEIRDEYRELVLKKIHNRLTDAECAQLNAIRNQLNELDRQSESWAIMEQHAASVEQQLRDIRLELESFPDA